MPHSAQRGNTRIEIKTINNVTPITNQRRRTWVLTWPVAYIIATTVNAPEMTPIHNDTDYIPHSGTKLSTGRRGVTRPDDISVDASRKQATKACDLK
jgi:hypothetical protein